MTKPEIATQKKVIKLAPAIGDWTTYKPARVLVKRVKTGLYGFDRLSKEETNQALFIHYRFVQKLMDQLRIDLGLAVEIFSAQLEQTTYLNFLRALPGQTVQCKIKMPQTHECIYLFLELSLANSIINYSLGSVDLEPINRGLTEAEKLTLETTLAVYLPNLCQAFDLIINNLSLSAVSSPDVVIDPTINASSTFVSFSSEVALADNSPGRIAIAYQGNTIKNLLTKYRLKEAGKALNFSRLPTRLLSLITAPVSATLGETTLTTDEIKQLEIGDVVSLDSSISSAAAISLGNLLRLIAQPGYKNNKIALRIVGLQETFEEPELPAPTLEAPAEKKAAPPPPIRETRKARPPAFKTTPPPTKPKPEELKDDLFLDEDLAEEDFDEDFLDEDFPEDKI